MIEELYAHFRKYPVISTDTRKDVKDTIFFALSGGSFNGNQFAKTALKKGAALAVVEDPHFYKKGGKYFLVDNALETLQQLAVYHRSFYKNPLVAITGSNGKTTTKELIAAVLGTTYRTTATQGNYNNHIGVPITLLQLTNKTEIAVIEMGANHQGEIANLCEFAKPGFGMITNIGKAHLEGFGSYEGVIKAKNELYDYLRKSKGQVIVNADDPLLMQLSEEIDRQTYGCEKADIQGEITSFKPFLHIKWKKDKTVYEIETALYGSYNFYNIMAAISVGCFFKISPAKINQAIANYIPTNNRSQQFVTKKNKIILDAYNANPVSMAGAINSFKAFEPENPWLILGDMFELGDSSIEEHKKIIELLVEKEFENVLLVGKVFSS
ncbi:MAG TPA: UDP-N-acetylmuramoyl-tripeptide--D-alanyl-D-alanine ligase, partial [Bacteroidales bacterium]